VKRVTNNLSSVLAILSPESRRRRNASGAAVRKRRGVLPWRGEALTSGFREFPVVARDGIEHQMD
jgi:hypothetical protein